MSETATDEEILPEETDTSDPSVPDNTVAVLRSWGLSGEPVRWADSRQQPVISVIRLANTGFSDLAAVQGVLDATYPDGGYDAADVALAHVPTAEFDARGTDPEVTCTLTTDADLDLPGEMVEFDYGDGTVLRGTEATHTYTAVGEYVIRCIVHVAGVAYFTEQDHDITEIPDPEPEPEEEPPTDEPPADEPYDPGAYTVDEVLAYCAEHPDEVAAVAAAEAAGKNRTTLLDKL